MEFKRMLLDVDSSILERNLKITEEKTDEEYLNRLFPEAPYKLHKPFPGMCLKMRLKSNKKLFVNICQLEILPEPADIKPEDIYNESMSFRVPMSIGDVRYEMDKNGEEATVVDIAINNKFFKKVSTLDVFTQFMIELVKQSLNEKYNFEIDDEVRVLKNKKCFGELQMHRIRKQEIDERMGAANKKEPLIKEISNKKSSNKPHIEILSDASNLKTPLHRFYKRGLNLFAEIYLPYARTSKDFTLDVGEDRLVLESKENYFLDVFFLEVDPDCTFAEFNTRLKVLTVRMKIRGPP